MTVDPYSKQILEVARSWIGTPYLHQACLKGVGADCLGFLKGVYGELYADTQYKMPPELSEIPKYTPSWAESSKEERLLNAAKQFLLPAKGRLAGRVLLIRVIPSSAIKHCGILSDENTLIHAYEKHGVVEEPLRSNWLKREMHVFNFPGVK